MTLAAIDRLIAAQRESKLRLDELRAAEARLTPEERSAYLVELIERVEAEPPVHAKILRRAATPAAPLRSVPEGYKTDLAEQLVLSRPGGVAIAEIAAHIGQNATVASSTMRYLKKTRASVERRNGLWCPALATASKPPTSRKAKAKGAATRGAHRATMNGTSRGTAAGATQTAHA